MTTPTPTLPLFMNMTRPSTFSKKDKQSHFVGVQIQRQLYHKLGFKENISAQGLKKKYKKFHEAEVTYKTEACY